MLMTVLVHLGFLVASISAIVYLFFWNQYSYWKRRKVPHETPKFPFGNVSEIREKCFAEIMKEVYDRNKHCKYFGVWFFHKPSLLLFDLDLIKNVFVKDFHCFEGHGIFSSDKRDPLARSILAVNGAEWKYMRVKMTPTFSTGKMKMMFPIVMDCANVLVDVLREPARKGEIVEMLDVVSRFSTDVISSVAFGIDTNSLKNPNAIFRVMARKYFEPNLLNRLRFFFGFIVPQICALLKVQPTPKEIADFFRNVVREVVDYRQENNVQRNDFLQMLIELMNKGYVGEKPTDWDGHKLTFDETVSEVFFFYFAGYETTATTMHFLLYELAKNQEIQDRLRKEVMDMLEESKGEITYENIHKMEYVGRVFDETLRKYPPAGTLLRACNKNFQVPGTDFIIEKGTSIVIPSFAIQMDERYYPDPEKFDPDRFLEDAKAARNQYCFMPFGHGPRICMGIRFAVMEVRIAMVKLLSNYRFTLSEELQRGKIEFRPTTFALSAKNGMHLRISELK